MSEIFDYYDPGWRSARFTCSRCGWSGATEEMSRGVYRELMDFSCGSCDEIIVIVSFPTLDDIRRAAQLGNPEAIDELKRLQDAQIEPAVPNRLQRIADAFARYFEAWEIRLPASAIADPAPGEIRKGGWRVQFRWGSCEGGRFLDFYAAHRMTNDRHHRIHEDGTIEDLEALQDWIVYPPDATEVQKLEAKRRFHEHNARVGADLNRKFRSVRPSERR